MILLVWRGLRLAAPAFQSLQIELATTSIESAPRMGTLVSLVFPACVA